MIGKAILEGGMRTDGEFIVGTGIGVISHSSKDRSPGGFAALVRNAFDIAFEYKRP